ncbi:MAG TPA: PDZ domain-containing protein, partial [Pirellulales bacterium]|nr:PDZ domain-containing protein [Pirellulales bacterium]
KGGLQAGDLITAINGQPVRKMEDFGAALGTGAPGDKVAFQIERAGTPQKLEVVLGARPVADQRRFPEFGKIPDPPADEAGPTDPLAPAGSAAGGSIPGSAPPGSNNSAAGRPGGAARPLLGVQTTIVTDAVRTRLNLPPGETGALVQAVSPGTPAERAGLQAGDVIIAIDNSRVRDPEDLAQRIRQNPVGKQIEIGYIENGQFLRKQATLIDAGGLAGPPRPGLREELPLGPEAPPLKLSGQPPALPPQPSNGASRVTPGRSDPGRSDPGRANSGPPAPPAPGVGVGGTTDLAGELSPSTSPPVMPTMPKTKPLIPAGDGPVQRIVDLPRRVEQLEGRVHELEQRISDLEKQLHDRKPQE